MSKHCLVVADYSQLEPRLMAHFSQDEKMLSVYEPGGIGDIYIDMASGVFGVPVEEVAKEQRNISKTLVLAMGYGAGDKKVGSILTVNGYPTTAEVGAEYVARLRDHYPRFFEWREEVIAHVKRAGYVQTIGGRHRRLKAQFIDRRNWKNVGYGERQAVNAIIQGSAGDIVRRTMVRSSSDPLLAPFQLLVQVHDELVWEAPSAEVTEERLAKLKWWGEEGHGFSLTVPLLFDPQVGASWHEGKEGAPLELPEGYDDDSTIDYEEER